jgi:uncharacterized protein YydD (DUF2326 family)
MHLKSLIISSKGEIIREIEFHAGLNLIVDNTPSDNVKETGNNVGKTTVLKLIDYCLGSNGRNIYTDPEDAKQQYTLVKDYLTKKEILITLILKDDITQEDSGEICIERNFLQRKQKVLKINGVQRTADAFDETITELLFPGQSGKKPTYRQLISHNIRYKDLSISNTLRTLDKFTSDAEYEALHLFMLGCTFDDCNIKSELQTQIGIETSFKKRLEKNQTKSAYSSALAIINRDIQKLNQKKQNWNINPKLEEEFNQLTFTKQAIRISSEKISQLSLRKGLILETEKEMLENVSDIDVDQIRAIYTQTKLNVDNIQRSFNDLLVFHNRMLEKKVEYIKKDVPRIDREVAEHREELNSLRKTERKLSESLRQNDTIEDLEVTTNELNEKYQKKGELENIIQQISDVEDEITRLTKKLKRIEEDLFSESFEQNVEIQKDKFNDYFSSVSKNLYDEQYALKFDIVENKKKQKIYKFSSFNTNFSSGKKQGEISCFDIAYILFADDENIPCMHFLLNDKKELMHGNQLSEISKLVERENIQFVAAILRDKLPIELNKERYFVVELSQRDKLFRIEK